MVQEKRLAWGLLASLTLACGAAHAQEAFTRQAANVRAGPDRSYPLVSQLGPGAPVQVMGCLDDWSWCDVAFDDNRGWVYGPFLLYGVPDDRVPLYVYGPSLGIAIVSFSLGAYWDDHYRQRSWYGKREEWSHREPPPHHAPTGLPPHAVYTPGMHLNPAGGAPAHAAPAHVAERSAAPEGKVAPAREMQHAPERPQEAGGQKGAEKGAEKGGEKGGEKPGREENR